MNYCLGTVQYGLNYGIQGNGQPHHEAVYEMLSYAIEHGIEQFDTASAYGEAENVLGGFIKRNPQVIDKMKIVSKLRPDALVKSDKTNWSKVVVENAENSLNRLGIKRFSSYLFHNAAHIFDRDAVDALYAVKEAGLTDQIGVSVYNPEEAMKALDYPYIEAIQIPYNVFDRRLDKCGFFSLAKTKRVIVYARSSLLQGLAVMNPDNLPERVSFARDYLIQYDSLCKEYSIPKLNVAIGYVAQKSAIDYIVFGVDNKKQLEEYLSMSHQTLPAELIERLDEVFDDVSEKFVNPVLWK